MPFLIFLLIFLFVPLAKAQELQLETISLQILGHTFTAEVANTFASRRRGLMNRKVMGKDSGMLFVFPKAGRYSMWMQNTYIPLSVAFINEQGIVLNIEKMKPLTKTAHSAAGMAKYALEMNEGWFVARKIKAGVQVIGLKQIAVVY